MPAAAQYEVLPLTRRACEHYILDIHYAKRWPSISKAFGLFRDGVLAGVVTFGSPASAPLRSGVCGPEYSQQVIELNRLVLRDNRPNEASLLVGRALRLLQGNHIVVSFADTQQGHTGIVYQACNFIYTGLSAKRTDWKIKGMEHLHGVTVADRFRGEPDRVSKMREAFGDAFYLADRPRKHRYVTFIGTNTFKREARQNLRYDIRPYPKRNDPCP
jgi:hypothetical protein